MTTPAGAHRRRDRKDPAPPGVRKQTAKALDRDARLDPESASGRAVVEGLSAWCARVDERLSRDARQAALDAAESAPPLSRETAARAAAVLGAQVKQVQTGT